MQNFIYNYSPKVFGTSLTLWLLGTIFGWKTGLEMAAWVGLIGSFVWCWNVILDSSLAAKDRILLNLVPFLWFVGSLAYLDGFIKVA